MFNIPKIDNTELLRIGLNKMWLSLNDLQCSVQEACQNKPKLEWSAKCSSCPFYLDLEDEARNLVTFCMAQIGNIGDKQITKYIKENYNG